jgi:hypothetical protein
MAQAGKYLFNQSPIMPLAISHWILAKKFKNFLFTSFSLCWLWANVAVR